MNHRCCECYDYKHPKVIRDDYNGDNSGKWRTCAHGCTVRGSSVHGCNSEGRDEVQ